MDLTVHHRVHIRNTELNVKELVTVGATCVMFPQDVQMFLQVIKCSISQIYAEELLFNYALYKNNTSVSVENSFYKSKSSIKS